MQVFNFVVFSEGLVSVILNLYIQNQIVCKSNIVTNCLNAISAIQTMLLVIPIILIMCSLTSSCVYNSNAKHLNAILLAGNIVTMALYVAVWGQLKKESCIPGTSPGISDIEKAILTALVIKVASIGFNVYKTRSSKV